MIISREGQKFELTPEEPESAEDVSAEEAKNFADEYGFSVLDAVNPDSKDYILGDLADRYEHDHDCNIDENSMWRDLIDDYLAEICK